MCKRFVLLLLLLVIIFSVTCDSEKSVDSVDNRPGTQYYWKTQSYFVPEYQFANNKIFDLGSLSDFEEGDKITAVRLFFSSHNLNGSNIQIAARLFVDPNDTMLYPDEKLGREMEEINPEYFTVDSERHVIVLGNEVGFSRNNSLGAWMVIENNVSNSVDTVGSINGAPLLLKLILHNQPDSSMVTWNYKWRNVYILPHWLEPYYTVDDDSLYVMVNIYRGNIYDNLGETNNQDGVEFTKILGLDRYDRFGNLSPDDEADVYDSTVIDPNNGLLIFPSRSPFNENEVSYVDGGVLLSEQVPEIYAFSYGHHDAQSAHNYFIEFTHPVYIPIDESDQDVLIGDINLDGIGPNFIDMIYFTFYFLRGASAFYNDANKQALNSDLNGDGYMLTVADLTYLIRSLYEPDVLGTDEVANGYADFSVTSNKITVNTNAEIGGIAMRFRGKAVLELGDISTDMILSYEYNGRYTYALIFGISNGSKIDSGDLLTYSGNLELISVDVGTYRGNRITDIDITQ